MAWTRNEVEELRETVAKVDQLRDEEEHDGLTEVTQNTNHGKRHSGKICESVSYKHTGGVSVEV